MYEYQKKAELCADTKNHFKKCANKFTGKNYTPTKFCIYAQKFVNIFCSYELLSNFFKQF